MTDIVKVPRRRMRRRRKVLDVNARPVADVLVRVKRLLKLATESTNDNEARSAAIQAARLIQGHRLRVVADKDKPAEPPPPPVPMDYDETLKAIAAHEERIRATARAEFWYWLADHVMRYAPSEVRLTEWWRRLVQPLIDRGF